MKGSDKLTCLSDPSLHVQPEQSKHEGKDF